MKEDASGRPVIGPSARTLGARPDVDLPVIGRHVQPCTGGVSVAPDDWRNLPKHRRPTLLGGTGLDPVWQITTDLLLPELVFRPDQPHHGLLEPSREMTLEEYQGAVASTVDHWRRIS
jgi:hypothetical protein